MTQKTTESRLDGRVCVITGATSGVGYQSVIRLAQGGAHNVIICRNLDKAAHGENKKLKHLMAPG